MIRFPRLFIGTLVLLVVAVSIGGAAALLAWHRLVRSVEAAPILRGVEIGPEASIAYDRDGAPIFTFFTEQRIAVPLEQVSPHVVDAVLAAEDQRFYSHHGLDPVRIVGAALENLRSGRIKEGASTITQQLVRATSLERDRTFDRKIREAILAAEAERRYTKDEILEAYLNQVYFGDGHYGIEAAARGYFGKSAAELVPAEAALLAGLIRAPSALDPTRHPEQARERRDVVLQAMYEIGRLTEAEYRAALDTPVTTTEQVARHTGFHEHGEDGHGIPCALYFREELRRQLVARFGEKAVSEGGLRVHTTLDRELQGAAEEIVTRHASRLDRRDDRTLQGALVALDPQTGEVLALVGGRDFHESSFNRATQARRQPGSAFKPLVYAVALERGYTPATLIRELNRPIWTPQGEWLPNGEHDDEGEESITVRRALKVSSNRAAAQLLQQIGVASTLDLSRRLGIDSALPPVPSLALGTGEVSLFELSAAYSAFANRGRMPAPTLVRRVETPEGTVLWEHETSSRQAIRESTAFLMSSMLADVLDSGTATAARAHGFELAAAGKTGTSDDYTDAWFVGYTPRMLTGVWFGYDEPNQIMSRGFASRVAVPAWADFMKKATEGHDDAWYDPPHGVERIAVCRLSGMRATDACHQSAHVSYDVSNDGSVEVRRTPVVYTEYFDAATAPRLSCNVHGDGGWTDESAADSWRTAATSPPPLPEAPEVGSAPGAPTPTDRVEAPVDGMEHVDPAPVATSGRTPDMPARIDSRPSRSRRVARPAFGMIVPDRPRNAPGAPPSSTGRLRAVDTLPATPPPVPSTPDYAVGRTLREDLRGTSTPPVTRPATSDETIRVTTPTGKQIVITRSDELGRTRVRIVPGSSRPEGESPAESAGRDASEEAQAPPQ